MWCPKCKSEYVKGVKKCNECGSELLEFIVEEEYIEIESQEKTSKLGVRGWAQSSSRSLLQEKNIIALSIKIAAVIILILGFGYSLFIAIDYWHNLRTFGQAINVNVALLQFLSLFGKCIFLSLLLFAIGELVQILHDIRRKMYES